MWLSVTSNESSESRMNTKYILLIVLVTIVASAMEQEGILSQLKSMQEQVLKLEKRVSELENDNKDLTEWNKYSTKRYEKGELGFSGGPLVGSRLHNMAGVVSLQNIDTVEFLNLHSNFFKAIKGLKTLTHLRELDLSSNKITTIRGLATLTNLRRLNLSRNNIEEITGLETLACLRTLILENNKITKISGLEQVTALRVLSLVRNSIRELTGLGTLVALERLLVWHNKIQKIDPNEVKNLTRLRELNLEYNEIERTKDIAGLSQLTNLKCLKLGSNRFSVQSFKN